MSTSIQNCCKWFAVFAALLFFNVPVFAQLSADFSANNVAGCAPVIVQYSDLSKGNPTQWRWDLGNGVTSTLKNPSTTYFNPGTYTVKLVVRNAAGADSVIKQKLITVHANPAVDFSVSDSTGCYPLRVKFTDKSGNENASIATWQWDFGDGSTSTEQNPEHTYLSAGSFNVTLRVVNAFGCATTISKSKLIQTAVGVKAGFTNTSAGNCKAPASIKFTNTSTGPGNLTYSWHFGDGITSTEKDPTHVYTTNGSYTVMLVAVSAQGCRDTIKKENLISLGTIQSKITLPSTICEGTPFTILNTTTPAPGSVLWNFGDGTTSTEMNPVKGFLKSGNYTIRLVNNFGSCTDTVTEKVTVLPKAKASFSSNKTIDCKVPATFYFNNNTVGATSYRWDFGDGAISTLQHPSHQYTSYGKFTVKLAVTNAAGCTDTLVKKDFITIEKPQITISGLPVNGCTPLMAKPTAIVTANELTTGYLWDFGDGNKSKEKNPVYTYNTAGTFVPKLTITTVNGCTETVTLKDSVHAGNKPKAGFTINPTDVCARSTVFFNDTSTGNVDQWLWEFGDGLYSKMQNPPHVYQDLGLLDVKLIVWSNTCPDTLLVKEAVNVKPPIAKFKTINNCTDRYKKDFKDLSTGATSWYWTFGDGATSTEQNPSHTYKAKGKYLVVLNVSNGTCTNYQEHFVHVIDEKSNFAIDNNIICKGGTIAFTAKDIDAKNIAGWNWNFGDGTSASTANAAAHVYTKTGTYNVILSITDSLGCIDTKNMSVNVYGPTADFTTSAGSVCLDNNKVTFTDATIADGTNALVKWKWEFGDGQEQDNGQAKSTHTYRAANDYSIALTVTDNLGCTDKMIKTNAVVIAQPKAAFYSADSLSCIAKPIQFNNQSTGYDLNYKWSFGDATESNAGNALHQYTQVGVYDVKLVATDKYGCTDSVTKAAYINISLPKAAFAVSDSFSTCPPLLVRFTNKATNFTSQRWDFGDGNTSDLANPSHYYNIPGIYYAKMYVTGPGGCVDSAQKRIEVRGPKGTFTYKPQIGCKPLEVTFTATTANRVSFVWDFSDGTTIATKDSIIKHTYTEAGDYLPKMILTDATGCTVSIMGHDTISVKSVEAKFEADNLKLCNSGKVNFTNQTISNDLILKYDWSFGDGTFSNAQNAAHTYSKEGSYTTQLIATTVTGCKDTVVFKNAVRVFEGPSIEITGDSAACVPGTIEVKGKVLKGNAATLQWSWDLGNNQKAFIQNPTKQLYTKDGNYKINAVVTDANGCKDSVVKNINIHPLPTTNAGSDALLCIGSSTQLKAMGAKTYLWKSAQNISCTTCANPVVSPKDTAIYVVTGTNEFGCTTTDSVQVNVRHRFTLTAKATDSICAGGTAFLNAQGADKYNWYPSTGIDNSSMAKTKARPTSSIYYIVVGRDNDNCFADSVRLFVKVNPIPVVDAGVDVTMAAGGNIQLNTKNSTDVIKWQWSPAGSLSCIDCAEPKAFPKSTTTYNVTVKNAGGCTTSDDVTVSVICNNGNLFIPNTFSPNGDGVNDRFYPRGTGIYMVKSLRVFNRWGEVVFEKINFNANDASMGWDGTYKGRKLSSDVFVYSCEVICSNNEVLPYSGDITLLQ